MIDVQLSSDMDELRSVLYQRLQNTYWAATRFFGYDFLDGAIHPVIAQAYDDPDPRKILFAPRGWGKTLLARVKNAVRFISDPLNYTAIFASYDKQQASANALAFRDLVISEPSFKLNPTLIGKIRKFESTHRGVDRAKIAWGDTIGSNRSEPTVFVTSVKGGGTGKHVQLIYADDIIGLAQANSPTECERAADWVKMSFNLTEHQYKSPFEIIGTRYHFADTYALLLNDPVGEAFKVTALPGFWDVFDGEKTTRYSGWESKFPAAEMEELVRTMSPKVFAAQIQQKPIQSEDALIQEEWLIFYTYGSSDHEVVNPVNGKVWDFSQLAIIALYDPAMSGDHARARNAIVVVGIDPDNYAYVLDTFARKCSVDTSVKQLIGYIMTYEPDVVGVEAVLFSELILPALERNVKNMLVSTTRFNPLRPKKRSKDLRIMGLQSPFERGRIFIHPSQIDLLQELLSYPGGETRDLLDALAYLNDVRFTPRKTDPLMKSDTLPKSSRYKLKIGEKSITGY